MRPLRGRRGQVTRAPTRMRDRDDEDPVCLDAVEEPVEEPRNEQATKTPADGTTAAGELE